MPEQITLGSTTASRTVFGLNPSLLKSGTITQTILGLVISVMVVTSVVVTIVMVSVSVGVSSPEPQDDSIQVYKKSTTSLNPLLNDYDSKSSNLTLVNVTQPAHGVAVLVSATKVSYKSYAYYAGNDSFTYSVTNGYLSAVGVVHVEVLNRAPELLDLSYSVSKNSKNNALAVFDYVSDNGGYISDPDGMNCQLLELPNHLLTVVQLLLIQPMFSILQNIRF